MQHLTQATPTADRELVITRTLPAPRELVWKAWTDPQHVPHWWGPQGFTLTLQEMDVRPGGIWRFVLHGADGVDYANKIMYLEIVKPERIVYLHGGDEGDPSAPFEVTTTFVEQGRQTKLTMQMVFASAEELAKVKEFGAVEGANSTLDRLEAELVRMAADAAAVQSPLSHPGGTQTMQVTHNLETRELKMVRTFAAPRPLVWQTWTQCEHLRQWWAPAPWTVSFCQIDLRPGGEWVYGMRGPEGEESWGKSLFQEVVTPERLVYIDRFTNAEGQVVEGLPELSITVEFHARGNQTEVISFTTFATPEQLEQLLEMGVVEGTTQTFDQLDTLLAQLSQQ